MEEPEVITMGFLYGEENSNEEEDEDASIDIEDRLHFPPDRKEIDVSKHIRDMVHLEITMNAVCDPNCKGLCLNCGTNLNVSFCSCTKQEVSDLGRGPLGELKKQMQRK